MIQGAIFDMDGTLLDTMPLWDRAGALYLSGLGVEAEEDLGKRLFPMTTAEAAAYLQSTYRLPLSIPAIAEGIHRTVEGFYLHDAPLKPGVSAFLHRLHALGIPMAVATVTERDCTAAALKRTGVLPLFKAVFTADEVGRGKDQPDIYLKAAEALGSAPARTLVFEDALHALCTARAAGFCTVGVYDDASRDEQTALRRAGAYYLTSFTEVSSLASELTR